MINIFGNRKARRAEKAAMTAPAASLDIDSLRDQIERNAQGTAETLRVEYQNFAKNLLRFVEAVETAEQAAKRANEVLALAGRTDFIKPIADRAFTSGRDIWPPPLKWARAVVEGLAEPPFYLSLDLPTDEYPLWRTTPSRRK